MAATLEELEKRLTQVEQEVARLQQLVEKAPREEMPAERGARLLREAKTSHAATSAATVKAFAEMGITGEPVGREKVRKMMIECGIKTEDNIFSREIISMREE